MIFRKISEEINSSDYQDINKALIKLKVRINTYGVYGDNVFEDSHIWKSIEEIERYKGGNKKT